MALGKTVATILSNKTAAASNSTTLTDCTTIDTAAVLMLGIGVKLTFNAAATGKATVKVFASPDDTNYDSEPCDEWDIPWENATVSKTVPTLPAARYLKVQVTNADAGQSITAIYVYSHPLTG
ncbi:MAG: hypothetical protein WC455_30375 [Dehalococcoidia bacterium]|jgi:hypothetical protein